MNKRYLSLASGVALLAANLSAGAPLAAQDNPGNKTDVRPADEGKDLYEQICQACHMADAKGAALAPGFRRWRPASGRQGFCHRHGVERAGRDAALWRAAQPGAGGSCAHLCAGPFQRLSRSRQQADVQALVRASRCRPIATPAATKLSHQEGCPPCSTISARKPAAACFR
jgi:hypothetical protein